MNSVINKTLSPYYDGHLRPRWYTVKEATFTSILSNITVLGPNWTRRNQHSQECKNPCQHCFSCLVTMTCNSKINGLPWIIVKHFYDNFCDPNCSGFWDIMWKKTNRQMHRQTDKCSWKPDPPWLPSAWITTTTTLSNVTVLKTWLNKQQQYTMELQATAVY